MKTYNFSFILLDLNINDFETIADKLYVSCNDALVSMSNKIITVEFDREDNSLKEAMDSARKDVLNSGVCKKIKEIK